MLIGPLTRRTRNIHLIGIGGSGMSGIAEILINLGFTVTGSDLRPTDVTAHLAAMGARIFMGHGPENVADCDVVVYSSAVKQDNPEIVAARTRKIPVIGRPEMLAELMRMKYGICIAGTHGKTTTTSMVARVLIEGGIDPTVIVGGRVEDYGSGAKAGKSHYLVLEADEYDRTFLRLSPVIAAVTTIDLEHLDCYRDIDDIKDAFVQFVNKVPFFGSVVACIDDGGVQSIMPLIKRRIVAYGISKQADVRAENIRFEGMTTTFDVVIDGAVAGTIRLGVPGMHNVRNALAAVAIGVEMNVDVAIASRALDGYRPVGRRFEVKGEVGGIVFVDDYAHHPNEILASLAGARAGFDRRVVAVFQPHLFSRTRDFAADFGRVFLDSDVLVVTDVYPSREAPIPGITGELVADAARDAGHKNVTYVQRREDVVRAVADIVRPNDLVIVYGAGDIYRATTELVDVVTRRGNADTTVGG